jgi:hypothetical protein
MNGWARIGEIATVQGEGYVDGSLNRGQQP